MFGLHPTHFFRICRAYRSRITMLSCADVTIAASQISGVPLSWRYRNLCASKNVVDRLMFRPTSVPPTSAEQQRCTTKMTSSGGCEALSLSAVQHSMPLPNIDLRSKQPSYLGTTILVHLLGCRRPRWHCPSPIADHPQSRPMPLGVPPAPRALETHQPRLWHTFLAGTMRT
jgi:hypothetical protein